MSFGIVILSYISFFFSYIFFKYDETANVDNVADHPSVFCAAVCPFWIEFGSKRLDKLLTALDLFSATTISAN